MNSLEISHISNALFELKKKTTPFGCILVFFFGTFNMAFSQDTINYIFYTELTSHLRGNHSTNFSLEVNYDRFMHSVGLDLIYKLPGNERDLQKDKRSFGINYKFGYDLLPMSKSNLYIGANLKYTRLHIHQIDNKLEGPCRALKVDVYDKSYHKITPLGMIQWSQTGKHGFYYGLQFGVGFPFLFGVKSTLNPDYDELYEDEEAGLSKISEHGYPSNCDGAIRSFAPQINVMIGFKLNNNTANQK